MYSVDYLSKPEDSDVEFPHRGIVPVVTSDQERGVDVLLNDPAFLYPVILQESPNCIQVRQHDNALTSISILSGLTDPDLLVGVV